MTPLGLAFQQGLFAGLTLFLCFFAIMRFVRPGIKDSSHLPPVMVYDTLEPSKPDFNIQKIIKNLRIIFRDVTITHGHVTKNIKMMDKLFKSVGTENRTYFERLDAHLQLLNHKIDGLLLYPEQSVKVSQFMQAQREQLAEDLKQGMTDSFHPLEPDDGDNSSLSLPTRDEAVNAAVQRFAKEIAWEHSLHYLQKQVNVNGVLLEVTLGIVGDAVVNSNEPYQWPTTAKAGMSTDDTVKKIHHA